MTAACLVYAWAELVCICFSLGDVAASSPFWEDPSMLESSVLSFQGSLVSPEWFLLPGQSGVGWEGWRPRLCAWCLSLSPGPFCLVSWEIELIWLMVGWRQGPLSNFALWKDRQPAAVFLWTHPSLVFWSIWSLEHLRSSVGLLVRFSHFLVACCALGALPCWDYVPDLCCSLMEGSVTGRSVRIWKQRFGAELEHQD